MREALKIYQRKVFPLKGDITKLFNKEVELEQFF